jgi:hypothetical protein
MNATLNIKDFGPVKDCHFFSAKMMAKIHPFQFIVGNKVTKINFLDEDSCSSLKCVEH